MFAIGQSGPELKVDFNQHVVRVGDIIGIGSSDYHRVLNAAAHLVKHNFRLSIVTVVSTCIVLLMSIPFYILVHGFVLLKSLKNHNATD